MEFREGKIDVIVSTDVCSRGIDIKDLDHVCLFFLLSRVINIKNIPSLYCNNMDLIRDSVYKSVIQRLIPELELVKSNKYKCILLNQINCEFIK